VILKKDAQAEIEYRAAVVSAAADGLVEIGYQIIAQRETGHEIPAHQEVDTAAQLAAEGGFGSRFDDNTGDVFL
jgi:hypothetical protein